MSSVPATSPESGRADFPALDTLRLVGATAVVATHTAFWAGTYTSAGTVGSLLARMDVGVAIFFVLSGFLLSREWFVRAAAGRADPGIGRYYWRRVLRIMPVYLVTVVLALSLITENRDRDAGDWLTTLALLDIYVNPVLPAGLTQMWSLATEIAFYVVLPFLMVVLVGRRLRPGRVLIGLAALAVFSIAWHLGLVELFRGDASRSPREWLPSYLIWFGLGIGLALVQVMHSRGQLSRRWAGRLEGAASSPGALWLAAAGLMLLASTPLAGPTLLVEPTGAQALTKNLLYAGVGALLVFSGVFTERESPWGRFMGHPVGRHLGHTSYALFCIHLPVMHLIRWATGFELFHGGFLQLFATTMVVSLVAAELLYFLVEKPFMRLRNLGRPVTPAASRATSAMAAPSENSTSRLGQLEVPAHPDDDPQGRKK